MRTADGLQRYFAYERLDGSTCYVPPVLHEGLEAHPHTRAHYRLKAWLGVSERLTRKDYERLGWAASARATRLEPQP